MTTLVFYPQTSSLQLLRSTHISLAETEQIVIVHLWLAERFDNMVKWFRNILQPHQDKCTCSAVCAKTRLLYTRKSELWKTDLGFCCSLLPVQMHACCATVSKSGAQKSKIDLPTVAQAFRAQTRQRSKSQRSHLHVRSNKYLPQTSHTSKYAICAC